MTTQDFVRNVLVREGQYRGWGVEFVGENTVVMQRLGGMRVEARAPASELAWLEWCAARVRAQIDRLER